MTRLAGLLVMMVAPSAWALCDPNARCLCAAIGSDQVGVVVTERLEQAQSTVRVETPVRGLDAGTLLVIPRRQGEVVGDVWVYLGAGSRNFVDDAGLVGCGIGSQGSVPVPLERLTQVVGSPSCSDTLLSEGFGGNCGSRRGGCSSTALMAMLPLLLLLTRRPRRWPSR